MPGLRWEPWQVEKLRILLSKGMSATEMQIGRRTTAAIQNKAARLNLIGDGIPRKPWSPQSEAKLKALLRAGRSPKEIATSGELPGYSRNAIVKKSSRMDLVDPQRSIRAKKAVRFSDSQLRRFHQFLKQHYVYCTPEQIALLWNKHNVPEVSRRRVIYHLTVLKIKRPWKEVMQMPYSKRKQRTASPKVIASRAMRWARYRDDLEVKLREEARRIRSRANGSKRTTIQACGDCSKRWPATEPFFVLYRKSTRKGERTYLGKICKLCRNKRRRERRKPE